MSECARTESTPDSTFLKRFLQSFLASSPEQDDKVLIKNTEEK